MEWPAQRAARPLRDCLLINYIERRVYIRFFSGRNISKYFEYREIFQFFLNYRKMFVYADLLCSSKEEIFDIWKSGDIYDCYFQFCSNILFCLR